MIRAESTAFMTRKNKYARVLLAMCQCMEIKYVVSLCLYINHLHRHSFEMHLHHPFSAGRLAGIMYASFGICTSAFSMSCHMQNETGVAGSS